MVSMGWVATAAVRESVRLVDSRQADGGVQASAGGRAHLSDMNNNRPRLWTPRELADFTGIPIRTLADWRTRRARIRGLGLPFVALSPHNVRYRDEDVEAFIAGRIVAPAERTGD